jgi:Uma2 family endonuclease
MSTAARRPTNAELCAEADALPEPLVGEVIDGVLYTMGRPKPAHANVEAEIATDLRRGARGGGPPPTGWFIQAEVEVRFPNDETVIPDISGWRVERIAGHRNDNPIRIVPDWVCEILSPGTRTKDVGPKRDMYARQRVRHLWIVDPDERVLEAFVLGSDGRWVLLGTWTEDATVDVAPFEGTKLSLATWWLRED